MGDAGMTEGRLTSSGKLNVFISYSRDDLDFADQLDEALQLTGFSTMIDRHGISGGEDWQMRLGGLIRDADTVVFVLSPASANSAICAWEVAEAVRLNKRILPVLCCSLDGQSAPKELAQLNFIFFYRESKSPGSGFGNGLRRLVTALNTDLDWLREHTRLLQRASEWVAGGRATSRLLSGSDISAAKAWVAAKPKDAPEPTALHLEFLRASEEEESQRASAERAKLEQIASAQRERALALEERELAVKKLSRRTAFGLSGAGGLTALSGGLAYWGIDAERRVREEQARVELARRQAQEEAILAEAKRTDVNGILTVYATGRGSVSFDNLTKDGTDTFTNALLDAVSDRNVSIERAIRLARERILRATDSKQRPYVTTDMSGEIYLQRNPGGRRLFALSIGNDDYDPSAGKLMSNRTNSSAWTNFMKQCGFDVTLLHDASLEKMRGALLDVENKIKSSLSHPNRKSDAASVHRVGFAPPQMDSAQNILVVFFYAGHGFAINGEVFIVPVDVAPPFSADTLRASSLPVSNIVAATSYPGVASVYILDTDSNEYSSGSAK
jgi:hypothetical protein